MGYCGGLAARWMKIPLILEVNGDHLTELETFGLAPQGSQMAIAALDEPWAARQATHTVATGEVVAPSLYRALGLIQPQFL